MAEIPYTPFATERDAHAVRLIVRRVRPSPGSQLALLTLYSDHACITDRDGSTLTLEADHRRHAEIENAIRDLKYGVGLKHLPAGRFGANAAWLAFQVLAHNLARWTGRIGLAEKLLATKTLRRRFFSLPGRVARSARRLVLHLPAQWPWSDQFAAALIRLRAIPLRAERARARIFFSPAAGHRALQGGRRARLDQRKVVPRRQRAVNRLSATSSRFDRPSGAAIAAHCKNIGGSRLSNPTGPRRGASGRLRQRAGRIRASTGRPGGCPRLPAPIFARASDKALSSRPR